MKTIRVYLSDEEYNYVTEVLGDVAYNIGRSPEAMYGQALMYFATETDKQTPRIRADIRSLLAAKESIEPEADEFGTED